MMSATGHHAHTGAAATPGDTHTPAAGDAHAPETGGPNRVPIDERVASDFFTWPRHQPPELSNSPRLVGLLYGLLCVDIGGKEVLLPSPRGVAHHALHVARIWFMTSSVGSDSATQVPSNATGTDGTTAFTYFDIAGSSVVFKAIDARGNELRDPSTPLKKRESPHHPWLDFKWIRCLKKLTGLPLIGKSERDNPALVSARVWLGTGVVSAFPAFSRDGQHGLWKVRQRNGKTVVSATTDSMLWSRPLPKKTARVRMTVTPLGRESGWYVDLTPQKGKVLLCSVTHAMLATGGALPNGNKLTHSKVFAKILKDGARFRFPVPEIASLPRPYGVESTDDVHCECASCP